MPPTDPARRKFLAALLAVPVISSCDPNNSKKKSTATTSETKTANGTDTNTTATATGTTATDATDTATTDPGAGEPAATTTQPSTVAESKGPFRLTGLWAWNKAGLYKIKQNGASIQGAYFDPDIPDVRGAIAGSVEGNVIKMTIAVAYETHPQDNFTAIKTGTIHTSNSMTLTVTGGPKYVGQVQKWSKISQV